MTQWTITRDCFADAGARPGTNNNAVGVVGPSGALLSAKEICEHPLSQRFQMFTDDDELVYEGYVLGPGLLAPLDDFGGPNFGCAYLAIFDKDGVWRVV